MNFLVSGEKLQEIADIYLGYPEDFAGIHTLIDKNINTKILAKLPVCMIIRALCFVIPIVLIH